MSTVFRAAICAASLISLLWSGALLAHEGHDHDAPPPLLSTNSAARAEGASETFELVAVARGAELAIYLDRFASNEPVEGATIEVETPTGSVSATARAGDSYRLDAPWAGNPGRYDLIFTITKDDVADVLSVTLIIPPSASESVPASSWLSTAALAGELKGRLERQDPAVLVAAFAGLLIGVVGMALVRWRRKSLIAVLLIAGVSALTWQEAHAHEGHDHGEASALTPAGRDVAQRLPDGGVFVPKSTQRILAIRTVMTAAAVHRRTVELPGRIIPDPNASGYVQAAVSGRLSPPPSGFPRLGTAVKKGDVLAYVTPPLQAIDVSDMRQRQGELDQQISIVERRLTRYEQLSQTGSVTRSQVEETRLELDGLNDRRSSLDKARQQPEAFVIAPVDGVIADGTPVAGQIAQTNAVVFHIVDPARLWVEALSFEVVVGAQSATASLGNGRSLPLAYQGAGFADRNQSLPIHFAIQGDVAGLRVGQFVTVLAVTDQEKTGLAVPRTSLVRSANGQDLVYEHVSAERFEPRQVRIEPLDGERVFIAAGLIAGKRVVVQGAELLDHVR